MTDEAFVKYHLRLSIEKLSQSIGTGDALAMVNAMIHLMSEILKPQASAILENLGTISNRLEHVEQAINNIYGAGGIRDLMSSRGRRFPSLTPPNNMAYAQPQNNMQEQEGMIGRLPRAQ